MAIVRLVWTSTLSQAGSTQVTETKEPGLDVFRRQPDGAWRISRYMAYEAP
jgi:steroid delta-isomerase